MATYDVRLPGKAGPRFPNRCIRCEAQNPGGEAHAAIQIGASAERIETLNLQVPCCPGYKLRFGLAFASQSLTVLIVLTALGAGAGVALGIAFLFGRPDGSVLIALLALGGAVIGFAAALGWQSLVSSPFNFRTKDGQIEYSFTSKTYAAEFAKLNNQRVPASWK